MSSAPAGGAAAPLPPVAIICGKGEFPLRAAAGARALGREALLVGIRGVADARIEAFPHLWLGLGQLGGLVGALRQRGIRHIAIAGAITRPALSEISLDWRGARQAVTLARLYMGGDNQLLSGVLKILEGEGLTIVGVQEIAPHLLGAPGPLTSAQPSAAAAADIAIGRAFRSAASPFDIGQAVAVHAGRVLAVEAAEGTDAMLARVAQLRQDGRLRLNGRAGVLVKAAKRGQDARIDLPAIGPRTLELAAAARLEGISFAAGEVLVLDAGALALAADKAGLFLNGHTADPAGP